MKFPLFLAPLLILFIALSRFVTLFTPRCLLLKSRATPHLVGISSTEKPHVAKQIVRDHDQVVNNQSCNEQNHCHVDSVITGSLNDPIVADENAEEDIEAHFIDKVLPVDQAVFPLGLEHQHAKHEQTGAQKEEQGDHLIKFLLHKDDATCKKHASNDIGKRVHYGHIVRVVQF